MMIAGHARGLGLTLVTNNAREFDRVEPTERIDRAIKLPIYARERVEYVWLVNPIQRTLEVLRREGDKWLTLAAHRDEERIRAVPFDAIELELGILWQDVDLEPPYG